MPAPTASHLTAQADILDAFAKAHQIDVLDFAENTVETGGWYDGSGRRPDGTPVYAEAKDRSEKSGKGTKFHQLAYKEHNNRIGLILDTTKAQLFDHDSYFINRFESALPEFEFDYYEVHLTPKVRKSVDHFGVAEMQMKNCGLSRDTFYILPKHWKLIGRRRTDGSLELTTGDEQIAHTLDN
jgi:hypothetical protein